MSKTYRWCPKCEKLIENGCEEHAITRSPAPFVIQDTLPYPKRLVSLHGKPMCESNSDIKRAMKAHDRKHGTALFTP